MTIMTMTTRITRQYLERKTKSDLAQMYLDLLDMDIKLEKSIESLIKQYIAEANLLDTQAWKNLVDNSLHSKATVLRTVAIQLQQLLGGEKCE
jgi:hypothetical protein